jgi:hypothetical protein
MMIRGPNHFSDFIVKATRVELLLPAATIARRFPYLQDIGITWVDAESDGPSCYSLLLLVNFPGGKPISYIVTSLARRL